MKNYTDNNPNALSPGLSMIVPVYNEREGLQIVIHDLLEILQTMDTPSELIVVDDGSNDGTSEIMDDISGIKVIRHDLNQGYGAAIKTGMKQAKYDLIGITDADGTYPNEKIPELLAETTRYDMVVGARVGKDAKIPLIRKPAKWILAQIANYLTQQKIPDLNSGLRIFRKEVAGKFMNILPNRFSFTTTITLAMLSNNYQVLFVPITYHPRKGQSKIRPIHDTINFLQLIIRTILYFDPLRIFLPIGLSLILTSCVLFILRLLKVGPFGVTIPMFLLAGIQVMAIGMLADLIDRRMKD